MVREHQVQILPLRVEREPVRELGGPVLLQQRHHKGRQL
jgi:hypothetical protein